jgi:hypothetical protein
VVCWVHLTAPCLSSLLICYLLQSGILLFLPMRLTCRFQCWLILLYLSQQEPAGGRPQHGYREF